MVATITNVGGTADHCLEPLMREVLADLAMIEAMLDITQHRLKLSALMLAENTKAADAGMAHS